MRRAASPSSDQEESNDTTLHDELKKLKDQYRILQNDRNKSIEDTKYQLETQNGYIDHLDNDNSNLNLELNLATSDQNKRNDEIVLDELTDLTQSYDNYIDEIENEKQKIASLETEIRKAERNELSLKRGINRGKKNETHSVTTQKKIRVLENRLSKQVNVYNTTLTENSGLRDEIEKLRNERAIFNKVYQNLDEELTRLRARKSELTEKATKAYDERDDFNNKCQALKDKNDKDKILHDMEYRDLQRIVDHDNRLRDFMKSKSNERMEWKKSEEERRKQHGSAGDAARDQQRQLVTTYEEAFKRIQEITGKEDKELIVSEFIKQEDENFAFFQFVSELNNEVENLHEEIDQLHEEKRRIQSEEADLEEERQRILKDLELKISMKKEDADKAEERLTEVNKILDQLRTGVKSVFQKVGCDDKVIMDMLGGDSDVSDRNIMLYMGSVEQKTNELLAVQYFVQTKQYNNDERKEQPDHGMTLGVAPIPKMIRDGAIVPPGIGDNFDDASDFSEDDTRPMSQAELMHKVFRDLKKHESKQGQRSQTLKLSDGKAKKGK